MGDDAQDLWGRTLAQVRDQLSSPGARAWVENARPVAFAGDRMVLAVGSSFAKERLERSAPVISRTLAGVLGRPIEVQVTIDETAAPAPPEAAPAAPGVTEPSAAPAAPDPIGPQGRRDPDDPVLNPKYTFETFVIGESNRFAHAAAMAVAEQPARSYNPLFIYGDAGLGKTHLLHAIGHGIRRLYPRAVVRYVSSEQFMNDFIQSVREERMPLFRRRYREADVLLIDDVQFLARGEQTQEEFFHTFNALHNDGRQIALTSDRAPKQIAPLEDRLRTRFEWGLLADVRPPDLETRVAILQKKAEAEGYVVPDAVLEYIATRVQNNIRELEGRLIRVVSYASLSGLPLTLELAQEVLRPLLPPDGSQEIPPDLIIEETVAYFSLSREDILGPLRTRPLVEARQVAMYLCRELTPLSLPKIGEIFGGRDHTTVLYADGKIRRYMRERRATYQQVQELTARIRGRATAPEVSE